MLKTNNRPIYFPFGAVWSKNANLNNKRVVDKLLGLAEKESILVLDAHISKVDIFSSASVVLENLNPKLIFMPVASISYYLPFLHSNYESLNKLSNFEFSPVFRREDRKVFLRRLLWKVLHKNLSENDVSRINRNYVKRSIQVCEEKNNLIVIAPFGDNSSFGKEIRKGVEILMKKGMPVVCSRSKFDWKNMRYEVFISDVMRFSEDQTEVELRSEILAAYHELDMAHKTREASIIWSLKESRRRKDLGFIRGLGFLFGVTKRAYTPITKRLPF